MFSNIRNKLSALVRRNATIVELTKALVNYASVFNLKYAVKIEDVRINGISDETLSS